MKSSSLHEYGPLKGNYNACTSTQHTCLALVWSFNKFQVHEWDSWLCSSCRILMKLILPLFIFSFFSLSLFCYAYYISVIIFCWQSFHCNQCFQIVVKSSFYSCHFLLYFHSEIFDQTSRFFCLIFSLTILVRISFYWSLVFEVSEFNISLAKSSMLISLKKAIPRANVISDS